MNRLLSFFRNDEKQDRGSASLELLFDFVIVAAVSLNFNGFILNSHAAPFEQVFLMIFSAGLIATHWYIHAFFRQRYEKNILFFRFWTYLKLATMGMVAAGMDLMVFRLNGDLEAQSFLYWFAPVIFIIGILTTRTLAAIEFGLAYLSNRDKEALRHLTLWKGLSRLVVVALALVHLALILTFKNDIVPLTSYIFLPIYLILEFVGNFAAVTDKNLSNSPSISLNYSKERFTRLNLLYISSLVISGSIQLAYYLKHESDTYMIYRFVINYFVAFLMWWMYADRVYRLQLKLNSWSMIFFTFLSTLAVMFFAPFGGMLINAYNDVNLNIIIPVSLTFLSGIIALYNLMLKFLSEKTITRRNKYELVLGTIPIITLLFAVGVASIYISVPIWAFYVLIIGSIVILNGHSRFVIIRAKKRKQVETMYYKNI